MRSLRALPTALLALVASAIPASADEFDDFETETLASGLVIEYTSDPPTTCSRPTRNGDSISVHYKGYLNSTHKVFDESYRRERPFTFVLGAGRVIKGWDQGLLDMCISQTRTLMIPSDLGYGDRGAGPDIPGGATLVFETKLMDIQGLTEEEKMVVEVTNSAPAETPSPTTALGSAPTDPLALLVSMLESAAADAAATTEDAAFSIATAPSTPPKEDEVGDATNIVLPPSDEWGDYSQAAEDNDKAECHLLGPFALLVQGALGALALLTLVWKRWREEPKRPWKIFLFDVSKQVLGSMLTHVINLALSMSGGGGVTNAVAHTVAAAGEAAKDDQGNYPNPCSYYLLNLGIDTTLGVPVLYILLKVLHALFLYTPLARPPQSIKSGHYGNPPKAVWYGKQLLIYCIGLVGMKLFVLFLFAALPWLPWVGDWALRWTEGNEALEISFALFIFPLVMNAIQYWVIDSFIMDKKKDEAAKGDYAAVAEEEDGEEGRFVVDDEDDEAEDADLVPGKDLDDGPSTASTHVGTASGASTAPHKKQA